MIREVVLDTETTGLDPTVGHRIVEIGAIELINHIPSGRYFHHYVNPQRDVPPEALAVHGLSLDFLRDKPTFGMVVEALEDFLLGDRLVIHNAGFDLAFLNAELAAVGRSGIDSRRVVDTLMLARQKHPMGPNSLDALCKRYGIDNSRRERHGALVDAQLLGEIYVELIGGRQASLTLAGSETARRLTIGVARTYYVRPQPLPRRLTEAEEAAHALLLSSLGRAPLWTKWLSSERREAGDQSTL